MTTCPRCGAEMIPIHHYECPRCGHSEHCCEGHQPDPRDDEDANKKRKTSRLNLEKILGAKIIYGPVGVKKS